MAKPINAVHSSGKRGKPVAVRVICSGAMMSFVGTETHFKVHFDTYEAQSAAVLGLLRALPLKHTEQIADELGKLVAKAQGARIAKMTAELPPVRGQRQVCSNTLRLPTDDTATDAKRERMKDGKPV